MNPRGYGDLMVVLVRAQSWMKKLSESGSRTTAIYLSSAALSLVGARTERPARSHPRRPRRHRCRQHPWYDAWPGGLTSVTLPIAELTLAASDLALRRHRDQTSDTVVTLLSS
ncbi:hypothetical protein [Nocardia vinacea]|uniref:hypothetical protein n=1 Tax=Nocardia vinacea TaxID=96468 RepID=UPI0002EE997F|nr:hypothetical protein [Nocardia vinacea]